MDEYIKREDAIKAITWNGLSEPPEIIHLTLLTAQKNIRRISTADVVPKSEVEELQEKLATLRKENTELLVSKETDIYISMEKLVKVRTEHPIFKAIEEKVAREIFEEIDKKIKASITIHIEEINKEYIVDTPLYDRHSGILFALQRMDDFIAELKKKYTE